MRIKRGVRGSRRRRRQYDEIGVLLGKMIAAYGSIRALRPPRRARPPTSRRLSGLTPVDFRGAQCDRLRSLRELGLLLCLLVFFELALKPVNRRFSNGASFFGDTVRTGLPDEVCTYV